MKTKRRSSVSRSETLTYGQQDAVWPPGETQPIKRSMMIGVVGQNSCGPVQLLQKNDSGQFMGQGQRPEAQKEMALLFESRGQTERSSNDETGLESRILMPTLKTSGKRDRGELFAFAVQRDQTISGGYLFLDGFPFDLKPFFRRKTARRVLEAHFLYGVVFG